MATILITGGHSGIGLAAARTLAARNTDIVLAGRSPDRMRQVAGELRAAHGVSATVLTLDTSCLASVRAAAAQLWAAAGAGEIARLDAILCNAGGRFNGEVSYSPDGYETTFATNCLGHFLFVELLLPNLTEQGRVVYTASGTHDPDTRDGKAVGRAAEPDALALANEGKHAAGNVGKPGGESGGRNRGGPGGKPLSAGKRYSTSKLCTVMYAYELDRRLRRAGSSIASIAFDPGSVPETGFLRGMPRPVRRLSTSSLMKWTSKRIGITTSDVEFSGAALASIATDPQYADRSGEYFQANDGTLSAVRSARISYDRQRAAKLWEDTKQLVALTAEEEAPQLR